MKKILFVILLFISSAVFATTKLVCDTNPQDIGYQFKNNWGDCDAGNCNWKSTWARKKMGTLAPVGGIRGPYNGKYPQDKDPQLTFVGSFFAAESDDRTELICEYSMANKDVCDVNCPASGNNLVYMRTRVYETSDHCKQTTDTTITCD